VRDVVAALDKFQRSGFCAFRTANVMQPYILWHSHLFKTNKIRHGIRRCWSISQFSTEKD